MRTSLYDRHVALGAKMTEFSGWEMPIQYAGIIHEHFTVRHKVGLFDVSHMGLVLVQGEDAEALLDYLSTNIIQGKKDGTATYTVWCNAEGGCVDDLIIYKLTGSKFFIVVNASNRSKDLEHLKHYAAGYNVEIVERYHDDGILALQGPLAIPLAASLFPIAGTLKPMKLASTRYKDENIIISCTGYTGSGGVEIFASTSTIVELWDLLLKAGQNHGIEPIGLGARDTLRLEMGYALYGHEISQDISPIESVSSWTVKWDKSNFLGKEALEQLRKSQRQRSEYGICLKDKGVVREGYEVFSAGKLIGIVTSGTFSPSLNQAIAIMITKKLLQEGECVEVRIRQNMCLAEVVKLPFYTER